MIKEDINQEYDWRIREITLQNGYIGYVIERKLKTAFHWKLFDDCLYESCSKAMNRIDSLAVKESKVVFDSSVE